MFYEYGKRLIYIYAKKRKLNSIKGLQIFEGFLCKKLENKFG
jgi:hypothetical protein